MLKLNRPIMDFGKVFIINARSLEVLKQLRCHECHERVGIGDVVISQRTLADHGVYAVVFHAFCYGKVSLRRHAEQNDSR